ncbi:MAG: HK97 gp10 family phage protein [Gordonia sp. (in: high G+C Gram-positive bacteria)]
MSAEDRAQVAQQAADEARSEAPVLTGDYRDGMSVVVDGPSVTIVDDDPDAMYKEYGTSKTPAHMTLTTAAARYGRYRGWGRRR